VSHTFIPEVLHTDPWRAFLNRGAMHVRSVQTFEATARLANVVQLSDEDAVALPRTRNS
jgi:hypothetical protein